MKNIAIFFIFINTPLLANSDKISSELLSEINSKKTVEMYILLKNRKPINSHSKLNRIDKLKSHINQLKNNSKSSQQHLEKLVKSHTKDYKFYWVNNSLWVKMKSKNAQQFLQNNYIEKAFHNKKQKLHEIKEEFKKPEDKGTQGIWNLEIINAPDVWALGLKGQGVIIAGQDTGYQWNHPSIKEKYMGWNGTNVDHNYAWHDSISNPIVTCQLNQQPISCDDHGHGTHTMGTMVGDDDQGNQIGVAPNARWMGCRNMDVGEGTPATYTECFQFFMEPTDLTDNNPDVTKAPHIINNSWGCPPQENCISPDILESVVNNVVDAGILVVAAAGNDGSTCHSINNPIAIYSKTLTIGSTTDADVISNFSSRGSVTIDGSNRIKPDITAPGSSILSADINGGYTYKSGTSMASPHVAGVAALMISANPSMAGKPKILKHVLEQSALGKVDFSQCSNGLNTNIPNNTFGWGRIDAKKAVEEIQDIIYLDGYEFF